MVNLSRPNLPFCIKVGNITFPIEFITTEAGLTDGAYGMFSLIHGLKIVRSLEPVHEFSTFIHEISHAIIRTYQRNNYEKLKEEEICNVMETGLTQVLIDNPNVVNYIKKMSEYLLNQQTRDTLICEQ